MRFVGHTSGKLFEKIWERTHRQTDCSQRQRFHELNDYSEFFVYFCTVSHHTSLTSLTTTNISPGPVQLCTVHTQALLVPICSVTKQRLLMRFAAHKLRDWEELNKSVLMPVLSPQLAVATTMTNWGSRTLLHLQQNKLFCLGDSKIGILLFHQLIIFLIQFREVDGWTENT